MSTTTKLLLLMTALATVLASACTGDRGRSDLPPGSTPPADGGPGTSTTPPGEDPPDTMLPPGEGFGWCCINLAYHSCPDRDAFVQCMGGFDVEACIEACDETDFECIPACFDMLDMTEPDPSGCTRMTERDGMCSTPSPGSCSEDTSAQRCDLDSDCSSDNCHDGRCYPNTVGSLCDLDSDCASDNCFNNCCNANSVGSGCDLDSDCESDNCYRSSCEGRTRGSGCDLDSDCDSDVCVSNTCE